MCQTHFFSRILFKHFICSFKQLINNTGYIARMGLVIINLHFLNLSGQAGWKSFFVGNKGFFKIFETLI